MAVFIPGVNCNICGKPVMESEDARPLPAFVWNINDPVFIFHDAVVHKKCLHVHPMSERAIYLCNELFSKLRTFQKFCAICNTSITDPDEYVSFTCLSSDENNPLSKYNFTQYG